jgi:hypothetical protein
MFWEAAWRVTGQQLDAAWRFAIEEAIYVASIPGSDGEPPDSATMLARLTALQERGPRVTAPPVSVQDRLVQVGPPPDELA